MMLAARAAGTLLAAALLVMGAHEAPFAAAPVTHAQLSDVVDLRVLFAATIPEERTCVAWAEGAGGARVNGARIRLEGCIHSNGDVALHGSALRVGGRVRHVGELRVEGGEIELASGSAQVRPASTPYAYDLAALREHATLHPGGASLDLATLAPGLHFVEGDALLHGTDIVGARASVVAQGRLHLRLERVEVAPSHEGLLAASVEGDVKLEVQDVTARGGVQALEGALHVSGRGLVFDGHLAAASWHLTGQDHRLAAANPRSLSTI